MKDINYLYCFFLLFLINSCIYSDCKVKELPQSEKEWTKPFKVRQKWIYKSNKDRIDTLKVLEVRDIYSPCNKFELGEYQFNQVDLRLKSNLLSQKSYGDIQFMNSIEERDKISQSFYFIDLSDTYYNLIKDVAQINIYVPKFNDSIPAFHFDRSNSKPTKSEAIINSFSWSKEYGILRYETREGEIFELVK